MTLHKRVCDFRKCSSSLYWQLILSWGDMDPFYQYSKDNWKVILHLFDNAEKII